MKQGAPDMAFKNTRMTVRNMNGTPDMRFKSNNNLATNNINEYKNLTP